MLPSNDAKQWRLDAFGQDMIDQIAGYAIREYDFSRIELLWAEVQKDFMGDPERYPSAMAEINDLDGRQWFHPKCQEMYFPEKSPCRAEESVPTLSTFTKTSPI
jgi:hypothetical protein